MPNVINQAVEANIPVVTIDSDAPNSKRAAYVGTDHYELGRIMGQKLVEYTGGEAKVGVATAPGQTNLERRIDGIKDVFASNRGMRIVQTVDNKGDVSVCARVVTQMLQANPDINAVACVNAASAGVATALRETNRVGEVTAVTSDINKPIADAVRNGAIRSTMVQRTYMEGYYGIQMLALLSHPTSFMQNQLQAGISPLPEEFDTGVIVVDKSNVGAFS
jgi:ribose transport system substrate-binding protein